MPNTALILESEIAGKSTAKRSLKGQYRHDQQGMESELLVLD